MGRSYKKWARTALMAGWMAWIGGCASQVGPSTPTALAKPAPPSPSTASSSQPAADQSAADRRFVIAPELEQVIHVVSVRFVHPRGAFLNIQVNVQNKTDAAQQFHYLLEWFDADGVRLPQLGGERRRLTLLPHEMSSLAVTAPSHAVADFEIAFVK